MGYKIVVKKRTVKCEFCGKKGKSVLRFYVCNKCNEKPKYELS